MPNLSDTIHQAITKLKNEYLVLPWYKRWFFPGTLGKALASYPVENSTAQQALVVCNAYLNDVWRLQRWLFDILNIFSYEPFVYELKSFNDMGLLAGETGKDNFDAIVNHDDLSSLSNFIGIFSNAPFFASESKQATFLAVVKNQDIRKLFDAVYHLSHYGLLADVACKANFDAVTSHPDIRNLFFVLCSLSSLGLLTGERGQASFNAVVNHQEPKLLMNALRDLSCATKLSIKVKQIYFDEVVKSTDPHNLVHCLIILHTQGLLTDDKYLFDFSDKEDDLIMAAYRKMQERVHKVYLANINALVANRYIEFSYRALQRCSDSGLLSGINKQANYLAVVSHPDQGYIEYVLTILHRSGLLTIKNKQHNFNTVVTHRDRNNFSLIMLRIEESGLLKEKDGQFYFDTLAGHPNARVAERVLSILTRDTLARDKVLTGELGQAYFKMVMRHSSPKGMAEALEILNSNDLLTNEEGQVFLKVVMAHEEPMGLAQALSVTHKAGLLRGMSGEANYKTVVGHQDHYMLAMALNQLQDAGLLSTGLGQRNFNIVIGHQHISELAKLLLMLGVGGLFTGETAQSYFDALITHSAILVNNDMSVLWGRVTGHLITAPLFARIIEICQENQADLRAGQLAVWNFINRDVLEVDHYTEEFNQGQSTHTASVHKSVSESAKKLFNRYKNEIVGDKLGAKIEEIGKVISQMPDDTHEIKAAKRCLECIVAIHFSYADKYSGVSLQQLLALSWVAIHDKDNRKGSEADAESQFIQGLYEIQRGYNLSATGVDDMGSDKPICVSGTFNKFVEKLNGLHPDADILFITKTGAAAKLPIVVNEEAMAYLEQQTPKEIAQALSKKEEVIAGVWKQILSAVSQRIFDEFGSLFNDNINSAEFVSFIAVGAGLCLSPINLNVLEKLTGSMPIEPIAAQSGNGFFAPTSILGAGEAIPQSTTPGINQNP